VKGIPVGGEAAPREPRALRKAVGKQLRFVARDLRIIGKLREEVGLGALSARQYRQLLVIQELYRQQEQMYHRKTRRIEDRIVSISQPHVRPIVRGKVRANVEFGAKVAISAVNGYARLERLDWDSFHEGNTLQAAVVHRKRIPYNPLSPDERIMRTTFLFHFHGSRPYVLSGSMCPLSIAEWRGYITRKACV
jgi:hypothetical protein